MQKQQKAQRIGSPRDTRDNGVPGADHPVIFYVLSDASSQCVHKASANEYNRAMQYMHDAIFLVPCYLSSLKTVSPS